MTAADRDDVQAREVEVVARAIAARWDEPWSSESHIEAAEQLAVAAIAALAPLRAAERQEAAREAWDAAMSAIHNAPDGSFPRAQTRETALILLQQARDRADGVTGREDV